MDYHHASRRIGVGNFTVASSQPFSRRFFDSLERYSHLARRPIPHRLTTRLGNVPQFSAVLDALFQQAAS